VQYFFAGEILSQSCTRSTQETPASSQSQLSIMKLNWGCKETHLAMTEAKLGISRHYVPMID
jgi:hypothetical protein